MTESVTKVIRFRDAVWNSEVKFAFLSAFYVVRFFHYSFELKYFPTLNYFFAHPSSRSFGAAKSAKNRKERQAFSTLR
jgi:hypothetical protein